MINLTYHYSYFRPRKFKITPDEVLRYELEYPDEPLDIETLLVDPLSSDIYLIQKSWFNNNASIYKVN